MKNIFYDSYKVIKGGQSKELKTTQIHHILKSYFDSNERLDGLTWKKLVEEYIKFSGVSNPVAGVNSRLAYKIGNSISKSDQQRVLRTIRELYFIFNIPYSLFLPEESRQFIVTYYSPEILDSRFFIDLYGAKSGHPEFKEEYLNVFKSCLSKCRETLDIYDYLGRGSINFPGEDLE